jgi:hypothetical protein
MLSREVFCSSKGNMGTYETAVGTYEQGKVIGCAFFPFR